MVYLSNPKLVLFTVVASSNSKISYTTAQNITTDENVSGPEQINVEESSVDANFVQAYNDKQFFLKQPGVVVLENPSTDPIYFESIYWCSDLTFSDMDTTDPMGYAGRCIINQDGKWAGTRGISAVYVPQTNIFEGVTFKDSDSYVYRFWDDGSTDMSILLWKTNDKGSSPSESSWSAFGHSTWMSTEEAAAMLNMTAAELTPETFGNVYADVWAETNAEDDEVTVQESSSFRNTMKPALVLSLLVMLNFFM